MSDLVDMLQELEELTFCYEISVNPHRQSNVSPSEYIGKPYLRKRHGVDEELAEKMDKKDRLIKIRVGEEEETYIGYWNVYHHSLCKAIAETLKILKGK